MNQAIGYREADVVVAGGGPAGVCAAIAAARAGASALLVEQLGFVGGMFSGGNMAIASGRPWAGIGKEVFDRLFELGAAAPLRLEPANAAITHYGSGGTGQIPYDPETVKNLLFEFLEQAGVRLLLHTFVTGAVVDGNRVRGVTVANKSGTQVAIGKVVVDCTGDADVAASAGAPFMKGVGPEKQMMAMTMMVRLSGVDWPRVTAYSESDPGWARAIEQARAAGELPYYKPRTRDMIPYWGHPKPELAHLWWEDGALLWGGTVEGVDGTDADSLTRAEVESRKQWTAELAFFRKHIPGFERVRVEDSAVTVGVRDTRHIIGEYVYTGHDILEKRQFPDTVAFNVRQFQGIPYRCLLPKDVDGLLVAGRCISAEPGHIRSGSILGAANDIKSIPTCMTYGQAVGAAAALCARLGVTPRALDVPTLQRELYAQGALPSEEEIAAIKASIQLPGGKTYDEMLDERLMVQREYWEAKGYRFFEGKEGAKSAR